MPRAGRSERGTEIGQIERGRGMRERERKRETDRERVRGGRARGSAWCQIGHQVVARRPREKDCTRVRVYT